MPAIDYVFMICCGTQIVTNKVCDLKTEQLKQERQVVAMPLVKVAFCIAGINSAKHLPTHQQQIQTLLTNYLQKSRLKQLNNALKLHNLTITLDDPHFISKTNILLTTTQQKATSRNPFFTPKQGV
ncbi:MAG: hypothetical protein LBQ98_07675 [Nitrososphaerota archaeon]|nr:hypothetical protein [Nitrososphaerota archaeon]